MKKLINTLRDSDFLLFFMCVLASGFGCLLVSSATRNDAIKDGIAVSHECLTMIAAVCVGIILCIIISLLDYNSIIRIWPIVALISVGFICSLFIWGSAPADRPDAICWLPILKIGGNTIYFQPSELAKAGFLVTFAAHADLVKNDINNIKNVIMLTVHALIPIGLIILTDDLGSAIVFGFMFVGMMFIAGIKLRYFAIAGAVAVAGIPFFWTKFLGSLHRQRILAVYYPSALKESVYRDVIYQQQRCLNAIGSGGFFGDGLYKGTYTQSVAGVPVNESDTVFSVCGEEFGFVGAFLLVALLAGICLLIIRTGKKSANMPGTIICYGCAFMIASQTIMNLGMCLKLLPCIGITLPFISCGGSSNLCIYLAIGLVMSVYRFNKYREPINFRYDGINTPFYD